MTKAWYDPAVARTRVLARLTAPGHHRTTASALAAVLLLILLFSAATAPLGARATSVVASTRANAELYPVPLQSGHADTPVDPSIDVLVVIVARKYRVSQEATREFVRTAYREGARHGIDPLLIVSVMAVESRFNPVAQSDGGAMGLMQVIPRYHAEKFDATNQASVFDPHLNIQVGVKILKEYIGRSGNELAGLQLYNGSPSDPSFAYATRVLAEKQWLQNAVRHARDRVRA
jgi:soluble lytic murein transglycosylase-like protein